jgi:two-component system, LytTR family, response regulator
MNFESLQRPIQAIILDDEIDACRNLAVLLDCYWGDKLVVMGIANSPAQAEQMMTQITPDVLFIDIEMPDENAFQFLERIGINSFEVIFVTAYDEYALRALKLNAVDYILKPISIEELASAISKLEEKLLLRQNADFVSANKGLPFLFEQIRNNQSASSIILKTQNETHIVAFKNIHYVQAEASYAHVYFEENHLVRSVLMSTTVGEYEELLPTSLFFRIHKTYLVNCSYVSKIIKGETYLLELKDKTQLPISRRRYHSLIAFLKELKIDLTNE